MSEPQNEEPVYVVNKQRRESEAVVHMPDCEKIRHQVEQDARPEGLSTRLQEIGRDAEGNLIYREMRVPAASHYTANYMTLTELKNSGFRYHPCGYCQPPVPTVDGPIPISVKARNLNMNHLGKEFIGWGVLERFTITGLPTEPCEDPSASKVRAAMKRAERAKAKMSPLKNGGNKPILTDFDKMSPLETQSGKDDGNEDKMSKNLDKMSPNNTLKYNYPSLPTGELPASGKRPTGEDGKNDETGRSSEAVTVMDHLTAIRSELSLTTSTPTKRDYAKIGNLVSRVAKAHDGDHAAAVALILAVIDWLPANTYWLRRIDSARRLADNWDQIANDWTVSQLENQRERDTEARTRDRKPISKPTPIPDHHSERHVHTLMCEHVLNDMKPHEAEYDHEGSLRSGHPSEWQLACMRHADELNQRDGLDKAA